MDESDLIGLSNSFNLALNTLKSNNIQEKFNGWVDYYNQLKEKHQSLLKNYDKKNYLIDVLRAKNKTYIDILKILEESPLNNEGLFSVVSAPPKSKKIIKKWQSEINELYRTTALSSGMNVNTTGI